MRPLVLTILFLQLLIVPAWPEDTDDNILLIGVDGAEWEVINELLDQGRLPNIKHLIANGARGKLQATLPLISPAIWTEIITGKSRKKHGILEFTSKLPETNVSIPVSSNMRKTDALWSILGNNSKSAGIVGWWATWPAEKVNTISYGDPCG
ncbi:MAG: alkaline phosphatase family protein [Candidatus Omnitrophica bacterium]|nr:alkaline phosphatase family protein [Candidatus Omnitrophota bacterium]